MAHQLRLRKEAIDTNNGQRYIAAHLQLSLAATTYLLLRIIKREQAIIAYVFEESLSASCKQTWRRMKWHRMASSAHGRSSWTWQAQSAWHGCHGSL